MNKNDIRGKIHIGLKYYNNQLIKPSLNCKVTVLKPQNPKVPNTFSRVDKIPYPIFCVSQTLTE